MDLVKIFRSSLIIIIFTVVSMFFYNCHRNGCPMDFGFDNSIDNIESEKRDNLVKQSMPIHSEEQEALFRDHACLMK